MQDKLKMWPHRKDYKDPILNTHGKSYGSQNMAYSPDEDEDEIFSKKDHDYRKEGKSKFYNVDSQQIPDEARVGRSKFYGTNTPDLKTPEKEGFQGIFAGETDNQDTVTLTEQNY